MFVWVKSALVRLAFVKFVAPSHAPWRVMLERFEPLRFVLLQYDQREKTPLKLEFEKFELSKTPLNQLCDDFVKSQLGRLTLDVATHSGVADAAEEPDSARLQASATTATIEVILFDIVSLFELVARIALTNHEPRYKRASTSSKEV